MEVQIREKIYNCIITNTFSDKYYSVLWSVQIINHKR